MKEKVVVLVAVFISIVLLSTSRADDICNMPVPTAEGPVVGTSDEGPGVCAYKGVPYAAPPVGDLRWRPPDPAPLRKNTLEATAFSAQCVQPDVGPLGGEENKNIGMSEDCLYLNIWRPNKPGKYPVMVRIHGGAFIMGSGSQRLHNGAKLSEKKDVVVVTINYRLGPLGFLAHPALAKESPNSTTGNYGLLDQTAALKWIKENIEAFGGDSDNITIFGESAGGYSVCYQLVNPLAKGLFHRAIMECGSCEIDKTSQEDYERGFKFAKKLKCDEGDVTACLRSKSIDEIAKTSPAPGMMSMIGMGATLFEWWPHVDGWSIVEQPIESLRNGDFNRVPLMVGTNRDEIKFFSLFMPKWIHKTPKTFVKYFTKKLCGKDAWKCILKLYPLKNYSRPIYAVFDYVGDLTLGCKSFDVAMAVSQFQPTYYYRFDYDDHSLPEKMGAAHGFEIPFIFDSFETMSFDIIKTSEQLASAESLAIIIMSYWANFARNADPNGPDLLNWPMFTEKEKSRMYLDLPPHVGPTNCTEKCDYMRNRPNIIF